MGSSTFACVEKMMLKQDYYNQFDGDLDELAYNSGLFIQQFWQREKIECVTKNVHAGLVLDIGCGSGMLAKKLVKVNDVIALDISRKCVENARSFSYRIYPVVGDAEKLPFKSDSFYAITCVEVIEHIDDHAACLKEINRILKENGKLYMTTPNYHSMWPFIEFIWDKIGRGRDYRKQHVSKFNIMKLKAALRNAGFHLHELYTLFFYTPFTALISSLITYAYLEHERKLLSTHNWGMLIYTIASKK
jgi:ubiquinone/menaquinone biosynthesis C-methylase UbiE